MANTHPLPLNSQQDNASKDFKANMPYSTKTRNYKITIERIFFFKIIIIIALSVSLTRKENREGAQKTGPPSQFFFLVRGAVFVYAELAASPPPPCLSGLSDSLFFSARRGMGRDAEGLREGGWLSLFIFLMRK